MMRQERKASRRRPAGPGRRGWLLILSLACVGLVPDACADDPPPELSADASALIRQLDAPDLFVRQTAFLQLEALRDPTTLPVIRRYLEDPSADTRAFSVRALAAVARVEAVPELITKLQHDPDYHVRLAAVLAMKPFSGEPAVASAMVEALRDRHPRVRMAAVDAVSRLKTVQAAEILRARSRREHHRDVRRVLRDALKRVSDA